MLIWRCGEEGGVEEAMMKGEEAMTLLIVIWVEWGLDTLRFL
jgi:hypothetical protein